MCSPIKSGTHRKPPDESLKITTKRPRASRLQKITNAPTAREKENFTMIYKTIAKCPHCGQEHEVEVEVLRGHLAEMDIATMTDEELKRAAASERSRMNRAREEHSARMDEINAEYDKRGLNRRSKLDELRNKPIEELTTDELKRVISAENSVRSACEKSGEEFTNAEKFKAYKREYKRRQALAMLESLDKE